MSLWRMATGLVVAALLVSAAAAGEQSLFDPATGYRIDRYRSPVTAPLPTGKRITLEELDQLVRDERAVLVDVMAAEGGGIDPETGAWRLSKPHSTLPGAIWLPDVGKGTIEPPLDRYFRDNLQKLTNGDTAHPVVIFCMADCWMSWNAVQRAVSYGYSAVYWYAEGVDGWTEWQDRTLVPAVPVPAAPSARN